MRHKNYKMLSKRRTAKIIGILFIIPFFTYSIGNEFITSQVATSLLTEEGQRELLWGAILILVNAFNVLAIGVLFYSLLQKINKRIAISYLITRAGEAIAFIVGLVGVFGLLLSTDSGMPIDKVINTHFWAYQTAMFVLALGSIVLFNFLLKAGFVPRFLTVWAIVGYILLALGAIVEVIGYPYSVYLSIPGGLFELVFAIWLITKGFTNTVVNSTED